MKRFASIVLIATVLLAMTAGTAFASVCVGTLCSGPMRCESANVAGMAGMAGMHAAPDGVQSSCSMGDEHRTSDISASQPSSDKHILLAVTPTLTAIPALVVSDVASQVAADARGAPRLSTVLRL